MKSMNKRMVSALLAVLLVAALAGGCASSPAEETASSTAAAANSEAGGTDAAAGGSGPLDPLPEQVTVSVIQEYDPDTWFPEGQGLGNNVLTDFYTEKLNIVYEVEQEIEKGQYEAKLNLAIASDDLPDMFYANASQVYRMASAGQILDQTEVYQKYASDNFRRELEINDMMYFAPAMLDGKIYGLPAPEDFSLTIPEVWVRQDWLDQLGIDFTAPKTNEDIYAIARTFMDEGLAQYGIQMDNGVLANTNIFNQTLRGLAHSKGMAINIFVDDGAGNLIYTDVQPEMKEFLKELQGIYQEGILDKEFAVKENAQAHSDLQAGNVGVWINAFTVRGIFNNHKKNQPEAEWTAFPLPPREDGSFHVSAESTCYRWLVVNSDFNQYPEAAIKAQNLWYELWQGEHAEYFHGLNLSEYEKAGENFKLYPPFWFDPPLKNLRQGEVFPDAFNNRDRDSIVSPETRKQYDRSVAWFDDGDAEMYTGWTNIHLFSMAFPILKNVYGAPDNILFDMYTGPTTETMANKKPLANQVRLEWLIKFIVGNADVDAEFDQYVSEWNSVGGADIVAEANEWYKNRS